MVRKKRGQSKPGKSKRGPSKGRRSRALGQKDMDVGLQVKIERTHQDEISWGAYIQLEPIKNTPIKNTDDVPRQATYLLEVSWPGAKLKTPHLVSPTIKGGMKTLQFLLAGPGYPGSTVLIRLRFPPALSFEETVTARAWNLATGVEQSPAFHTVSFEPGQAPSP